MKWSGRCAIVGALDAGNCAGIDELLRGLEGPEQSLAHNSEFSGRPTTRLLVGASHVIKLRVGEQFDTAQATAHALAQLQRERLCAIHVPSKTWFVLGEDPAQVGNITPRLVTLQSEETQRDAGRHLQQLQTMLRMYVMVAGRHRLRLDEGLSNFGVDAAGRLYYLDDDFYPWDDFAHLGQFLGVLLRKPALLTPGGAGALGQSVRAAILEYFEDPAACRRLARLVRALYFSEGVQQERCDALQRGLDPPVWKSARRALIETPPLRLDNDGPIAVVADIHSNLPSLQAAGEEIRRRGIRRTLVLGDVVGYGPHPRECIRYLRQAGYAVLKGNHDHVAVSGVPSLGFSRSARQVIDWTRTQLDEEDMAWLEQLPLQAFGENWMAQHGAPMDPAHFNAYVYRLTFEDNLEYLKRQGLRWAFHGHTHMAGVYYSVNGVSQHSAASLQRLSGYEQALVCPGSVGQPRGGAAGAELAVFDPASASLELVHLHYDVELTAADMVRAGLADTLIQRLRAAA